jgi:acetate kinase
VDGIVFTGGIGQRDAKTRREVVAGCGWLGAVIDDQANAIGEGRIDGPTSQIPIWVLNTDEERVIARHTAALLNSSPISESAPVPNDIPKASVSG